MKKEYDNSDERYLNLIKDIDMGSISTKFCPECKRVVPDNDKTGCPICGCKEWDSDHPLTNKLIDEDKVTTIAEDTYNLIIKPFKNINCDWKNGKLLYKHLDEDILLKHKEDKEYFLSDCEFWGIVDSRHVSLCVKYTRKVVYDATETEEEIITEVTNVQFCYMLLPELWYELNEDKDEDFFFNLFINDFIKKGNCFMDSYQYKTYGKNDEVIEKTGYIYFRELGSKYTIYSNGFCAADRLRNEDFSKLIQVIDDFTILPRYYNRKEMC